MYARIYETKLQVNIRRYRVEHANISEALINTSEVVA